MGRNPITQSEEGDSALDLVLRLQREVNEKLLVTALQAQDEAAGAYEDKLRSEEEAKALRVLEEELRATAEFRELLIGIIGHDLRSPLNTIVMAAGYQLSRGKLTDEDARFADRIVTSGHRMGRMISQLIEFTRARLGGGFELNRAPTDLGQVCFDIVEELRISESANIHLSTEGEMDGVWDADRLAEVVSNITGNAVEHATPGTPVLVQARGEGDSVAVEITNQGACIPPAALPLIFSAFRRADVNTHSRGSHLGLGLYIAYEVMRSHAGTLEVRSSEGTTTFTMRLPRA